MRIAIAPSIAAVHPGESVTFTVTGIYLEGITRILPEAGLSTSGGTLNGSRFVATAPGTHTVTAALSGLSDRATINVLARAETTPPARAWPG